MIQSVPSAIRRIALVLLAATLPAGSAAADEPLRLLFIGNSFTNGGPIPVLVAHVAEEAGWTMPVAVNAAVNGQTLEYHTTYAPTLAYIDQGNWDYVVLQEYSTRPTDSTIGNADPLQFKQDATWLYDRIKASSPDAVIVLYETWARHEDHSVYPTYYDDRDDMQEQLNYHYQDAAENYIPTHATYAIKDDVLLAPCGEAWGANYHDRNVMLHGGDLYHAGPYGQYLNAYVIYGMIYGRKVEGLTYPASTETYSYLQQLADAATGATLYGGPDGFAAAEVAYEGEDLGDGLTAWTFRIACDDEQTVQMSVAMGFQGADGATIHQVAYNGVVAVNTETLATLADGTGTPPYDMAHDTWVYAPLCDNTIPGINPLTGGALTGFYEAANAYALSCYTGTAAVPVGGIDLARVVADGNVEWTGSIARGIYEFEAAGVTEQSAPLPGDFNGDCTVSGADYVVWADTFGNTTGPGVDMRADANGDGLVSGTDYVVWANNFGRTCE